jgi:integrase
MSLHSTKLARLVREALHLGKERYFSDGGNLYLRVQPSGSAAWVIRKRLGPKLKLTTLGAWNDGKGMSLADARQKAGNIDPRAAAHEKTLGTYLREYYGYRVADGYRRPHHLKGYLDRLEQDEPGLWNTKLWDLEHLDVFRALKTYARNRGKVGAARCTSILKTALNYAINTGDLTASPIVSLTVKVVAGPSVHRSRTLTDDEIRGLWHTDSSHTPLLRFLLLTGQRIGEAQLATWEHVVGDVWHIPVEHSKNKHAHWVPLPPAALAIIKAQDHQRRKVFGHTSSTATQAWLKRWCAREEMIPAFRPHDLRRTFSTRLNELGVSPHIVERMLNHTMQGVMATYNRADYTNERREAATRWAVEVERLVAR